MKLLRMTATFGCLNQETVEFHDGFHLISAPNGSGKSTWCAFLRTMLYGLDTKQRDKKDAPADKNRYRPWSGAAMEGLLVCEYQGQTLEIRRTSASGVPMGDFSAVDAQTGQAVPEITGENLGELLTGVSREVFDRSVFLRQTGLAVSQSQELEKRITALVSSGEEDVSWTETDELLKTWQHRRRFHKSGSLPQLEARQEEIHAALDQTMDLRREISQLRSQAAELRRQKDRWDSRMTLEANKYQTVSQRRYAEAAAELDAAELRVQTAQDQLRALHNQNAAESEDLYEELSELDEGMASRRRWTSGFLVFAILLTAAGAVVFYVLPQFFQITLVSLQIPPILLVSIAGLLWLLTLLFGIIKAVSDRKDRKDRTELETLLAGRKGELSDRNRELQTALNQRNQAKKYFDAVSQQGGGPVLPPEADQCRESLAQVEKQLASLQGQLKALGEPVVLEAELDNLREETDRQQRDYDALEIAMDALKEADGRLHARFSPQLSEAAGAYFAQLTGGRYTQISLNRNLEVTVRDGEGLAEHPLFLLSQGTADQLYLALRLAVAQLVFPPEHTCPLILDDALLSFDDTRLSLALDCLLELAQTRQVLLFTCRDRESQALGGRTDVTFLSLKNS